MAREETVKGEEVVRSKFSEQTYAADFGRYEGTRAVEYPAHELFVGREGQRAHFLNLLLTVGRKGSYLVTGHRGSGKTAFVKFCLDEYRENAFRRYLRSNVGRRLFWDRLGHFVFALLLLLGFLLASEALQELALLRKWTFLDGIVAFLLGLLCCYPFLAAYELLDSVFERWRPLRALQKSKPKLIPAGLLLLGILLGWRVSPLGEPALALSQLFALVAWAFLVTVFFSFNTWERQDNPGCDDPSLMPTRSPVLKNSFGLALIAAAAISMLAWPPLGAFAPGPPWATAEQVAAAAVRNWLIGMALIACGVLQRSFDQFLLRRELLRKENSAFAGVKGLLKSTISSTEVQKDSDNYSALRDALYASATWHLLGAALLSGLVISLVALLHVSPRTLIPDPFVESVVTIVTVLWILALIWRSKEYREKPEKQPFSLHPRPRVLLGLKAIVFLSLGLQLAYPVVVALSKNISSALATTRLLPAVPGSLAERFTRKGIAFEHHELLWLVGCALLILLLVFLEYEWIVRPYATVREDVSIHGRPKYGRRQEKQPFDAHLTRVSRRVRAGYQARARKLAEQTFFWKTFQTWLPVLAVPVNLGFDRLEHRLVIEAMLAGLKDAYRRAFLHWSSPFVALQRVVALGVLLVLSLMAGQRIFAEQIGSKPACEDFTKTANRLLCALGGQNLVLLSHASAFAITDQSDSPSHPDLLLYDFVRVDNTIPRAGALRLYHLFFFVLFYFGWSRIRRALATAPYQQTYDRISGLLDSLSSRLRTESRPDRSKLTEMLGALIGRESVEEKEFGPFDPRTVEISFLQILADSQDAAVHFPFAIRHRISPPLPEIIFVFDELDKIGTGATPEEVGQRRAGGERASIEREPLDRERERSRALFAMFADLKNILSAGVARFIFIGGRNLHDEWLADQSARRPLLTSIFDAEIYIPSLLTDEIARREGGTLLEGIRLYVSEHLQRARSLHQLWRAKTIGPWLRLWLEERRAVTFVQGLQAEIESDPPAELVFRRCEDGTKWTASNEFHNDFIEFLAYRSRGNPKKLRELIETYLRPVGRSVNDPQVRLREFDCEHVLVFHDWDRFRVQLVADIFRQIGPLFEERLRYRDDKLSQGLFYLSDFLLKFHRRAFTWSNLERVDELVHIHRAPDLRGVLEDLVLNWTERYLHVINNSMYDYRFESDFARELEYLSRHSEHELAAFNFTLDESQSLKITYRKRLEDLQESSGLDFVVALGELHEFDEEYEVARFYYKRAVRSLDQEFRFQTSHSEDRPQSFEVLLQSEQGLDSARRIAAWGVARIRLMLQIGMTYERSRDLEHAHVEYRDARTLASAVIRSLLGWEKAGARPQDGGYLWTLKHLNIFLHPVLAEAWLAEKSIVAVDTAPSLLERELWELRSKLPFVSPEEFPKVKVAIDAVEVQHSNFSLTLAELHSKAGTLYFFKGRQLVRDDQGRSLAAGNLDALQGTEGYLPKALAHYALSLHEIRRFNSYRRESSRTKLCDYSVKPRITIGEGGWPEYVYRVAAGTLSNLAECLLARVSLVGLWQSSGTASRESVNGLGEGIEDLYRSLKDWLDDSKKPPQAWGQLLLQVFPSCGNPATELSDWLGSAPIRHGRRKERKRQLIEFGLVNSDAERLATSVIFSLAGARILEDDGYFEGAARECLRVVRTVSHYLWWLVTLDFLADSVREGEHTAWRQAFEQSAPSKASVPSILEDLLLVGIETLDRAQALFKQSRRFRLARLGRRTESEETSDGEPDWYLRKYLGNVVPVSSLTLACSLGLGALAMERRRAPHRHRDLLLGRLKASLAEWTGHACPAGPDPRDWFRERLMDTLDRDSFPVNNRLLGLKVLLDDALVQGQPSDETEDHVKEILRLEQLYKSPLHFPPLLSGVTLAMAFLSLDAISPLGTSLPLQSGQLLQEARHRLSVSQQMYTMKHSYYETISGLYYLYDDFNDRTIHYNQAIQMASTELASYFLSVLTVTAPRAQPPYKTSLN